MAVDTPNFVEKAPVLSNNIERREVVDRVTGYKVVTLIPAGFTGDIELHFCGNNQKADDEIRTINAEKLINQRAQNGELRAIAFVTGANPAGKDKYSACSRKGALTSMVNAACDGTPVVRLTLSAASRGGEGLAAVLASSDPMLSKVVATNSFDSTYYGASSFLKFAQKNSRAKINIAYIESGATGKTAEGVKKSLPATTVVMIPRDKTRKYLDQHVEAPGQYMRIFDGLPADDAQKEQAAAQKMSVEVPSVIASAANVLTLGMIDRLNKFSS